MKRFLLPLLILAAAAASAAEPWICTTDSVRVAGCEPIRTPAGEFTATRLECRTFTSTGDQEVEGGMTQWVAPGTGLIRQEVSAYTGWSSASRNCKKSLNNP